MSSFSKVLQHPFSSSTATNCQTPALFFYYLSNLSNLSAPSIPFSKVATKEPGAAAMADEMLPISHTVHVTPDHNRVTITFQINLNHQPGPSPPNRSEDEARPEAAGGQNLVAQNKGPVQGLAVQSYISAPKEPTLRKSAWDIQPNPYQSVCKFATPQQPKRPIDLRTQYDTGCDVNLISETNLRQLKCHDSIRPVEDSAPLVSLSDANIELIGQIDLLWLGRKRIFCRTVERLTFLVVPSSNTAVTGPIIGAISLNTLGLLRRAFGASLRKFESKSKGELDKLSAISQLRD